MCLAHFQTVQIHSIDTYFTSDKIGVDSHEAWVSVMVLHCLEMNLETGEASDANILYQ